MKNKKLYGGSVVAASWLAVFCLFGYRATFAILKGPMSQDLGWTQTQVTLGYSLMMVFYAITAFFSGLILDRWGTKPVYAVAAFFGGFGFFLTSLISSHILYLFTFGFLAGIATGMLWVTSTVSVRKWYIGKSYATMWGIAFAGAPMAQFLLAYLTKYLLANNEPDAWRNAMQVLSVIIFAALLLAVLLAKKNPEHYKFRPFGETKKSVSGKEYVWSVKEAFSRYAIWGAILMFLTSMMAEFLIWTQVVSYWIEDLNWTHDSAIKIYAVIGIVGIFSMPIMGIIADAIVKKSANEAKGRKKMLLFGPLIGALACGLLLHSGSSVWIAYLSCFIFAIYWAVVPGGVVGYTGAIYGRATLGKIWGLATLFVMGIGPFTGSFIGGLLKDISGTYSYSIYYALFSFLISAGVAFSLPLRLKNVQRDTVL